MEPTYSTKETNWENNILQEVTTKIIFLKWKERNTLEKHYI